QAEHDTSAQSILITDDAAFGDAGAKAVDTHLETLPPAAIAGESWRGHGRGRHRQRQQRCLGLRRAFPALRQGRQPGQQGGRRRAQGEDRLRLLRPRRRGAQQRQQGEKGKGDPAHPPPQSTTTRAMSAGRVWQRNNPSRV
ncbi:histidinol dehydrogenase, partial [Azospirillum sp. C340-1]